MIWWNRHCFKNQDM